MLATAERVQRLLEGDVGRVVVGDHAARVFRGDAGRWARRGFVQHRALPAVVLGMVADGFEAPLQVGGGTTALDRLQWNEGIAHPCSVPRGHLTARDTRTLASADRQHGALLAVVDDLGGGQVEREDGGEQAHVAAGLVQPGHAGPLARGEQEEGDPQREEDQLQRARCAQRAQPHVEGEHAPQAQVPADEGGRHLVVQEQHEQRERPPERAVAEEGGGAEGVAARQFHHAGDGLRGAAIGQRAGQHQAHAVAAEPAGVDHAEQPGGQREAGQAQRRGVGKFRLRACVAHRATPQWTNGDGRVRCAAGHHAPRNGAWMRGHARVRIS